MHKSICCHQLSGSSLHTLKQKHKSIFNAPMTIKAKTKKSRLRFVIIDVHSIWKSVWVGYLRKNNWILSLRYNLQRSVMLFHEAEIFSFEKNIISSGPFPDPPFYYTGRPIVCEGKVPDNGGVPGGEQGERGERAKNTDEID